MKANFRLMTLILVLMVISSVVCNALPEPQASATPSSLASAVPAETKSGTASPESTATRSQPTATLKPASAGPQCTVLQNLNLRPGPGTAYRPPLAVIPANTVVIPVGYNPIGRPEGSWVLVQDPVSQKNGWVSAGEAYVACNLDLTTLPAVAVADPNPPAPRAQSSNENGTCGSGESYDCAVVLSDESLVQFKVLKDGQEIGENDGVENVSFTVTKDDVTVYSIIEINAAYCIFGGNGPCNSWVFEDDVYKWENGGVVVEEGLYRVNIDALATDSNGEILNLHWDADVTVTLP